MQPLGWIWLMEPHYPAPSAAPASRVDPYEMCQTGLVRRAWDVCQTWPVLVGSGPTLQVVPSSASSEHALHLAPSSSSLISRSRAGTACSMGPAVGVLCGTHPGVCIAGTGFRMGRVGGKVCGPHLAHRAGSTIHPAHGLVLHHSSSPQVQRSLTSLI